MRILFIVLTVLLLLGFFGFVLMNGDVTLPLQLFGTEYPAVSLHWIVLGALAGGAIYVGIIGVAQGVQVRAANRRLSREVQRLESELNYLRTQPSSVRGEPEAGAPPSELPSAGERASAAEPPMLPSAPVYGSEDDDDLEDDVYTGGRAV